MNIFMQLNLLALKLMLLEIMTSRNRQATSYIADLYRHTLNVCLSLSVVMPPIEDKDQHKNENKEDKNS